MPSFRRVAFSLGLVAACGGAIFFSLSAKGQPQPVSTTPGGSPSAFPTSASPSSSGTSGGGATASGAVPSGTVSPPLRQTIGISPVQVGKKAFVLFGGTGNDDSYDLQNEVVYSLLRQRGVPIPNVLHPLSTAKPSFIVERLIVLSLTGGNNSTAAAGAGASSSDARGSGSSSPGSGATGAAAAPAGPSDAEQTVSAVRAVVDAEIARGSGRLGGAHRQKLQLLSRSIRSLESANRLGALVTSAVGGDSRGGGSGSAGGGTTKSKLDPREIFYGQARVTSRRADRYAPTGL